MKIPGYIYYRRGSKLHTFIIGVDRVNIAPEKRVMSPVR